MIITMLLITFLLFLAIEIQKHFTIPSPVTLITLSYIFYLLFPNYRLFSEDEFAELVIFLIPMLISSDALSLKLDDLNKNRWSLIYLAVVAVVLSVIAGIITSNTIFSQYNLSIGATIALFAMVLATDPVSVVSIFSSFRVPHKLKILAEGESLFNDATALIIFSFIAIPMINGEQIGAVDITLISLKVILLSIIIGLVVGFLGIFLMQQTQDTMSELLLIIITAYLSFEIAEHFHVAGLLSVIVAIVTLNHITEKSLKEQLREDRKKRQAQSRRDARSKRDLIKRVTQRAITTTQRHEQNLDYIKVLALLANALLFISMASIVDIDNLLKYKKEILFMFLITTLIRAIMMGKFALISNNIKSMTNINFRWWSVLLFAGIKGGLSIVMITMLPEGFKHKEMFDAIVIGVIILSTFVYAFILVLIIMRNRELFEKEYKAEHHH